MIPKFGSKGNGILFGSDVDASDELVGDVVGESDSFDKADWRSVRRSTTKADQHADDGSASETATNLDSRPRQDSVRRSMGSISHVCLVQMQELRLNEPL